MELSQNYEFLAAALTAVTGDLVLDTAVPGDNTSIPDRYNPEHLWHEKYKNSFDLEALDERVLTYYCPPQDEITEGSVLYIRTVTGVRLKLFIDLSSSVLSLKQKIQEKTGIHPDQQRLMAGGMNSLRSQYQDPDKDLFMNDLRPIASYQYDMEKYHNATDNENEANHTIMLMLFGGRPPSALLLEEDLFDTSKNCDFTWLHDDKIYRRGNFVYNRPYGWIRIEDKYSDNRWFGEDPGHGDQNYRTDGLKDEWPVAYHGSKDKFYNMLKSEDNDQEKEGVKLVKGYYSCPDPKVAEKSAASFSFKSREFKVMIQSRVNMNDTAIVGNQKFYSTANLENIRPVGLLIKSVD